MRRWLVERFFACIPGLAQKLAVDRPRRHQDAHCTRRDDHARAFITRSTAASHPTSTPHSTQVLAVLKVDATDFLNHENISRREINSVASYCSSSNVVVAKAQEILRLYDEATSVVRSMMKKVP
jgi:hypothetical protein